jgi:hypothetical protein
MALPPLSGGGFVLIQTKEQGRKIEDLKKAP